MTLDHRDDTLPQRLRDAQRAVVDYAETVTDTRARGTLSAAALDRLADATHDLAQLRALYISGDPQTI